MNRNILSYGLWISLISIAVIFSGCITSEHTETKTYPQFDIELDAGSDTVEIEVMSGDLEWEDYRVTVDGVEFTTSAQSSSAGDSLTFADPDETFTIEVGEVYEVEISNIEEDKIIAQATITADY
ncbi:MAG: hypothetical protein R6V01_05500 [Thermoplasmatota archaeon]